MTSDPRRLREALDVVGYTETAVLAALGLAQLPEAGVGQREVMSSAPGAARPWRR